MGFHFDSVEAAKAHLRSIAGKIDRRTKFKVEAYADGSALLLIDAPQLRSAA